MGRLNRVFEHAGMPYGPCLELGSEVSKEAAKKRKNDASAGPAGKHAKVSGQMAMALKASAAPRGSGAASLKMALAKTAPAPHAKSAPKVSYTVPRERERSLHTCAQDVQITRIVTI
jgi:hypothetical protein